MLKNLVESTSFKNRESVDFAGLLELFEETSKKGFHIKLYSSHNTIITNGKEFKIDNGAGNRYYVSLYSNGGSYGGQLALVEERIAKADYYIENESTFEIHIFLEISTITGESESVRVDLIKY